MSWLPTIWTFSEGTVRFGSKPEPALFGLMSALASCGLPVRAALRRAEASQNRPYSTLARLTLAQARSFFLFLPALPLHRLASCIASIAHCLLLRSYSCLLFGLQACRYLGFLGGDACRYLSRLQCRAFLGGTPIRFSVRFLRNRLFARNACLSLGIVRSGGCTEFLEQHCLGFCRCSLPLAEVGIVAHSSCSIDSVCHREHPGGRS